MILRNTDVFTKRETVIDTRPASDMQWSFVTTTHDVFLATDIRRPRHRFLINVNTSSSLWRHLPRLSGMYPPRRNPSRCMDWIGWHWKASTACTILEIGHQRVINDRIMSFLLLFGAALSRQYTAAHRSLSFIDFRSRLHVRQSRWHIMGVICQKSMNNYAISSALCANHLPSLSCRCIFAVN